MKNNFVNQFARRSLSLLWPTLLLLAISCKETSNESVIAPGQQPEPDMSSTRMKALASQIATDADYTGYRQSVAALRKDILKGLASITKEDLADYKKMQVAGNSNKLVSTFLSSKVKKYAQYQSTMSKQLANLSNRHSLSTKSPENLKAIFATAHQLSANADADMKATDGPIDPDPGWGDDPGENPQNPDNGDNPGNGDNPTNPDGPGNTPNPDGGGGGGGNVYYPSGFSQSEIFKLVSRCFGDFNEERIGGMVLGIVDCATSNNAFPTSEECLEDTLKGYLQDSLQCILSGLLIPSTH